MQKNSLVLKRRLLIDGEEIPGLVETGALKDEEGDVEVPSFGRIISVKSGVKKFDPIECVYKIDRDTITEKFMRDWFYNDEYHDVTVENVDATGAVVDRILLQDCENGKYDRRPYNASGVEFMGVGIKIICTSTPVPLSA